MPNKVLEHEGKVEDVNICMLQTKRDVAKRRQTRECITFEKDVNFVSLQ